MVATPSWEKARVLQGRSDKQARRSTGLLLARQQGTCRQMVPMQDCAEWLLRCSHAGQVEQSDLAVPDHSRRAAAGARHAAASSVQTDMSGAWMAGGRCPTLSMQRSMVSLVSWRGGSYRGRRPIISHFTSVVGPVAGPLAMPRALKPLLANSVIFWVPAVTISWWLCAFLSTICTSNSV